MTERLPVRQVRTGPEYESGRLPARARLASSAQQRRVPLATDLVLVFETAETIRTALEESLRAERTTDPERVVAETAVFADLLGGGGLAAVLYVDVADPVALSERLTELSGIEQAVSLEVGGRRVPATADPVDAGTGAFYLLFELDDELRAALAAGGPVSVRVDHPTRRAVVALDADQQLAIGADVSR